MSARGRKPPSKSRRPYSVERRMQAREAISEFNRKQRYAPKCGAWARSAGRPCQNVPMANGRCYRHGGRIPKGAGWHKPVWPNGDAPNWSAKLAAKEAHLAKREKARRLRVARMTPEQRASYEHWQKTHKPGAAGRRAQDRAYRDQDKWARESFARWAAEDAEPPRSPSAPTDTTPVTPATVDIFS